MVCEPQQWVVSQLTETGRSNIGRVILVGSRRGCEDLLHNLKHEGIASPKATLAIKPAEDTP